MTATRGDFERPADDRQTVLAEALRRDGRYWSTRDRVWVGLVLLATATGAWFGAAPGPVPLFAGLASWVLAVTWLVAGRDFLRRRAVLAGDTTDGQQR